MGRTCSNIPTSADATFLSSRFVFTKIQCRDYMMSCCMSSLGYCFFSRTVGDDDCLQNWRVLVDRVDDWRFLADRPVMVSNLDTVRDEEVDLIS